MKSEHLLLPRPKKIVWGGKCVRLDRRWNISFNNEKLGCFADALCEFVKKRLGFSLRAAGRPSRAGVCSIALELDPDWDFKTRGGEAYCLEIRPRGIVLRAPCARGIFHGTQTLRQIIENGKNIKECKIEDWPDLPFRGVHLMLQDSIPDPGWFHEAFDRLAGYKINSVIMEYEDKFPYRKHAAINHPLAFGRRQIKELNDRAGSLQIQIIPLLQSLGHVEYILKHDAYARLRERADSGFEYCPLHPGAFALFKDLADELLAAHPGSEYFHIGGDEAWFLGECERCRKVARSPREKSRLFVDYVNRVADYLIEKGKIPIVWSDVLVAFPQELGRLNKKIVIMYWDYQPTCDEQPFVKWKWGAYFGEDIQKNIPEEIRKIYLPYWDRGNFPVLMDSLPYLKFFMDRGFDVIGAARAQSKQSVANMALWARRANENRARGIIATTWPLLPLQNSWHSFAFLAEKAWNASNNSHENFKFGFARTFFGLKEEDAQSIHHAGMLLGAQGLTPENLEKAGADALAAVALLKDLKPGIAKNHQVFEDFELRGLERVHLAEKLLLFRMSEELMKDVELGAHSSENMAAVSHRYTPHYRLVFNVEYLSGLLSRLEKLNGERLKLIQMTRRVYGKIAGGQAVENHVAAQYADEERKTTRLIGMIGRLLSLKKHEEYSRVTEWFSLS
ncbi:MAG: glycoside hydrolase family 20 zincin-like fold domain-containing protein [Verrucomicrobiae bacterium]|nr:glycoside hydrolase family 20 zincin-like fold domain-containing protein [Verrucomicrobiae bacterium]